MNKQVVFELSVHEAGHYVAAQLLGATPTLVKLELEEGRFAVRHDIPADRRKIALIVAAGFAAEQILLGGYKQERGEDDARRIVSLGWGVPEMVTMAGELLKPYELVLMSVALAIEAAASRGQQQVTAEGLRLYYELALETVQPQG